MAVTTSKLAIYKSGDIIAFPVAASETIYSGTFAVINSAGYLQNATSTTIKGARLVVIPAESFDNSTGLAGVIAADGTGARVCKCYIKGVFKMDCFTSITQLMVGQTMFITDNYTIDETQTAGIKAGMLLNYYSATGGYFSLNEFSAQTDGTIVAKVPLVAAGDGTAGAVLSWANPTGKTIMIENLLLDITTAPTDNTAVVDFGVAANGTTASDTIINGAVLAAAGVFDPFKNAGSNGTAMQKATSSQYITGTSKLAAHLDLAGMVGTAYIYYRITD